MKTHPAIAWLFWIGGLYDGLLGLAFLIAPLEVFAYVQVEPPNHRGYVQFPAALLVVFALMFFNVARDPLRNRNLIPYGILLKVAYSAVVFYHWALSGIPWVWKPFAFIDLLFGGLFLLSWLQLHRPPAEAVPPP